MHIGICIVKVTLQNLQLFIDIGEGRIYMEDRKTNSGEKNGLMCCSNRKSIFEFIFALFSGDGNPYKGGLYRCPDCGALFAVPTFYYSVLLKTVYLISSAFITLCVVSFTLNQGIYQSFGRLITTLILTVCIAGGIVLVDKAITATVMRWGKWRTIELAAKDEQSFLYKEKEMFKRDHNAKYLFAILGYALGICIFAANLALTIAALFGMAIGIPLRFYILRRTH